MTFLILTSRFDRFNNKQRDVAVTCQFIRTAAGYMLTDSQTDQSVHVWASRTQQGGTKVSVVQVSWVFKTLMSTTSITSSVTDLTSWKSDCCCLCWHWTDRHDNKPSEKWEKSWIQPFVFCVFLLFIIFCSAVETCSANTFLMLSQSFSIQTLKFITVCFKQRQSSWWRPSISHVDVNSLIETLLKDEQTETLRLIKLVIYSKYKWGT